MSEFLIAIHSLIYLGLSKKVVSSKELSENACVNSVRIRKVMLKFLDDEVVLVKKGINGGYFLNEKVENISLGYILKKLDFNLVDTNWNIGNIDSKCMISSGMPIFMLDLIKDINIDIDVFLSKISLKNVIEYLERNDKNVKKI